MERMSKHSRLTRGREWLMALPIMLCTILTLSSCDKEKRFAIDGTISGAADEVLYLEYMGLSGIEGIDSITLSRDGKFHFSEPVPEYPDFYRLRLGKQLIPFAVDTLPTELIVNADARSFATSYSIEGNQASEDIRKVWLALLDANVALSKLNTSKSSDTIERYYQQRDSILCAYKEVAEHFIYNDPQLPVSYFALFQQVDGQLVFNLYDQKDSKAFAAIANVYQAFQPNNPRTEHLYNLALRSIAVVREQNRIAERTATTTDLLKKAGAKEVGYIDFTLPDTEGHERSLSDIVDNTAILLVFSSMSPEWANTFNASLSEIYKKYHAKGLEIVQVSLDDDPHIWLSSTHNLPWINLIDREAGYSRLVGLYNLNNIPSLFIISKGGDELFRILSDTDLEQLLAKQF